VFNHGDMRRDFTYVTDLVRAIRLLIDAAPVRPESPDQIEEGDSLSPVAPWRVVNIGNGESVPLMDFIAAIEGARTAGDQGNAADAARRRARDLGRYALLRRLTGYAPQTSVREGTKAYVDWYREYYGVGA
jgi:UDP-glucuronate 4-epimerase